MKKLVGFFLVIIIIVGGLVFLRSRKNPSYQTNLSISPTQAPTVTKNTYPKPSVDFKIADGYQIGVFVSGLGRVRDLVFSPGGTLLVSNPDKNQVIALPSKKVVLNGGNKVHGLAFFKDKLYVAEMTRVARYNWDEKNLSATFDKVLFTLPSNNDHNLRTIIFDNSGRMFVSVGSTCNVCLETDKLSATILVSDADGNNRQVFAKGLRNAPFMTINPGTKELWATEMGRDYLGDDLPPDEIDIINSGKDYGWPFCYGQKQHDNNFDPLNTHSCEMTESPIFEIPAHSAPLGLTFMDQNNLLVSYHGSWNRSTPAGYKIVKLKVSGNKITGSEDFMTGFSNDKTRPVDVILDNDGKLFISDDKGGNVYIVQH